MNRNFSLQIAAAVVVLVAGFLVVNPTHILMPYDLWMMIALLLILVAVAFSIFVLAEGAGDERDNAHRSYAGRVAFFVGALVMVAGIAYQAHFNNVDPWLLLSLCAMITGKVVARLYASFRY